MSKTISDYEKEITRALRTNKLYNKALTFQITSLAGLLAAQERANEVIAGLGADITVEEKTRYGQRIVPHPAFKIQHNSQKDIIAHLKALGLTAADLAGGDERDPLVEVTKGVQAAARKANIIKPD